MKKLITDEEFFATYDPTEYRNPAVAVDVVMVDREMRVCLKQRMKPPQHLKMGLPGAFMDEGEYAPETAVRAVHRGVPEIDSRLIDPILLGVFGRKGRDIRTRVMSISYLVPVCSLQEDWFPMDLAVHQGLAFDHYEICLAAKNFIHSHIYDPTVVRLFLPTTFSLSDYRKLVEVVTESTLDPSNFRKNVELTRRIVRPAAPAKRGKPSPYAFSI